MYIKGISLKLPRYPIATVDYYVQAEHESHVIWLAEALARVRR